MYLKLGSAAHMYQMVSQTDTTIVHHVMSEKKFFQLFQLFQLFDYEMVESELVAHLGKIENQGYNVSYLKIGV